MEEEQDLDRYEGDYSEKIEDYEIVNWVERGEYGFIEPHSQFEIDDDIAKQLESRFFPWNAILGRWRHRLIAAWRLIRHW